MTLILILCKVFFEQFIEYQYQFLRCNTHCFKVITTINKNDTKSYQKSLRTGTKNEYLQTNYLVINLHYLINEM